jgi:catechol 2,3-dioxygenase-like lactoylglutathione lyase family enzyme
VPAFVSYSYSVDRLYHPTHYVTDLDEAEEFFRRVFGRASIPLSVHQDTRTAPPFDGYPRDYSIFTPIADVYFDCLDPSRYRPQGAAAPKPLSRSGLRSISWGLQGVEALWPVLRDNGIRCTDQWGNPANGDDPPVAAFASFPLIYTLPDDTGLSYEFLPTEWIPPADKRGDPSWTLPPVADSDPLGIERCSHHTILTGDRDRALRLLKSILGGSVVREGRNEILGTDSTFIALADAVFEFATPTIAGTPAMDDWQRRAPRDVYHALTWKVASLERTKDHLRECGIGLRYEGDETVITDPADTIGIPWGFTTATNR